MERFQINMSCGQTDIHPACLDAMSQPVGTPVYYPVYQELEQETTDLLKRMFNTESDVVMMLGTATYGLEAAMQNAVEPGDTVITVNSGSFGGLLTALATAAKANVVEIKVPDGDAVSPEQIEEELGRHPTARMVCVVYSETSMGTLNPIPEIGEMMKRHPDVLYLVDTVSIFGGIDVRFDDWRADFCCTTTQKCLTAPQGIAIVAVSPRAWDRIEKRKEPVALRTMNLKTWKGSYVLTKALHASLTANFEEGLENVYRRHRVASKAVREAARALGLGVKAVRDEIASPSCTKILWPEDIDMNAMKMTLYEKYGVSIGGDRIGTMGFLARPQYVLPTISAIERTLVDLGYEVPVGAGVAAATRVFAEDGRA